MIRFSFIIVTYNSIDLIKDCLSSIYEFEKDRISDFEIIVVDNSNYENHQLIKSYLEINFPNVILIHNSINGGYGQGNNVGISNAKGDYICIMNPDVRISEPLLEHSEHKFMNNESLGLFAYKQIGGGGISFFIKPEYQPKIGVSILTKFLNKYNKFSPKKHFLSGAFFFVRKKVILEIGKFDENIFLYFEEPDISNRILKRGYQIEYDNSKTFIHLNGDRNFSEFSFKIEMNSLKYYIEKFNLNRKKIQNNYLTEYTFNSILFKILGWREKHIIKQREIEIIKKKFSKN